MRIFNKYMYTNKRCVHIPIIVVRKAIRAIEMYEKYNLVNGAVRCHVISATILSEIQNKFNSLRSSL